MNKKKNFIFILLSIIFSIFMLGCYINLEVHDKEVQNTEDKMKVNYIDVGQGDSILVQVNNKNLLIDAGPKSSKGQLIDYLDKLNIKKLDYVIATHPHEDHIGGMSYIIDKYEVGSFYAPKVEHTTKTFERMIDSLKGKNLNINVIKEGTDSIDLGLNTKVEVFSSGKDTYNNLNNYSPIIRIEFNNNSFLLTGDAEKEVEKEVLEKGYNLKSDVLKFGHHGSSTSTTEEFFNAVNPSIGVIQLGKDNDYGHPHKETLELIKKSELTVYRTDKDSNIVLVSDGDKITKE